MLLSASPSARSHLTYLSTITNPTASARDWAGVVKTTTPKMMKRIQITTLLLLAMLCLSKPASAQFYSVRVNTLALLSGTVNIGADAAINDNWTLDVSISYNPISNKNLSLSHSTVELGAKHWFFENFVGHFVGQQLKGVCYDVGDRTKRTEGKALGAGVSYGYAWILSTRWNLAVEAGVAIIYCNDTTRDPTVSDWDSEYIYHKRRVMCTPSRFGVTLNYLF